MTQDLYQAAARGDLETVKDLLRSDPAINVNLEGSFGWTPLQRGCREGHDASVALLLAHPGIDVNLCTDIGVSPFFLTCTWGHLDCARLMLADPRVRVEDLDENGFSPLRQAASYGHVDIIRLWIASGREIDLGEPGNWRVDPIMAAKDLDFSDPPELRERKAEAASLLERFSQNPEETRSGVREQFGYFAPDFFALVVFLSDGLLVIRDEAVDSHAARFFRIVRQLPMELQMVQCYRLAGCLKTNLGGKERELAFKELAKNLQF